MAELPSAGPSARARIEALCAAVEPPSSAHTRMSRMRQRALARPVDGLGHLDKVTYRISGILRELAPGPLPAVISVLAADHGVAARGTSLYGSGVGARVLGLIADGRSPLNVVADLIPARVEWADVGLLSAVGDQRYKTGDGTGDIADTDAMSLQQAHDAVLRGAAYARDRLGQEPLLAVGEIGIGNTTATAALTARLLGAQPSALVGPGTGVDAATVEHKRRIVADAVRRTRGLSDDPLRLLAALGGYEIAGNVGVILTAAAQRRVVVLDGYITAVAALVAVRLCPAVQGYLVAAHRSAEPGHQAILDALGLRPLLDLEMRMGMASGAALALGLINSALALASNTPPARLVELMPDLRRP
jgi:nicotinate-nucleotide--dimethylbenzimidazole phosphoribosyltransferase